MTEYLSYIRSGVDRGHLIVRGEGDPIEMQQAEEKIVSHTKSVLNTEELGGESAQEEVGDARIMSLLKELEVARKERTVDPAEAAPKGKVA